MFIFFSFFFYFLQPAFGHGAWTNPSPWSIYMHFCQMGHFALNYTLNCSHRNATRGKAPDYIKLHFRHALVLVAKLSFSWQFQFQLNWIGYIFVVLHISRCSSCISRESNKITLNQPAQFSKTKESACSQAKRKFVQNNWQKKSDQKMFRPEQKIGQ